MAGRCTNVGLAKVLKSLVKVALSFQKFNFTYPFKLQNHSRGDCASPNFRPAQGLATWILAIVCQPMAPPRILWIADLMYPSSSSVGQPSVATERMPSPTVEAAIQITKPTARLRFHERAATFINRESTQSEAESAPINTGETKVVSVEWTKRLIIF